LTCFHVYSQYLGKNLMFLDTRRIEPRFDDIHLRMSADVLLRGDSRGSGKAWIVLDGAGFITFVIIMPVYGLGRLV
jgi:hypothetical protein